MSFLSREYLSSSGTVSSACLSVDNASTDPTKSTVYKVSSSSSYTLRDSVASRRTNPFSTSLANSPGWNCSEMK
ncbi:hypothetical protein SDJN03_28006, partial [Cucurbita argyrosperma subsp. sororia]